MLGAGEPVLHHQALGETIAGPGIFGIGGQHVAQRFDRRGEIAGAHQGLGPGQRAIFEIHVE